MGNATEPARVHFQALGAERVVANALRRVLTPLLVVDRPVVCLCIGTDRSTGDALGPLVGHALRGRLRPTLRVVGWLEEPVHASNLSASLEAVQSAYPEAVVVAVDACLGRLETVGTITVGNGPLCPGAGVNKILPEVGAAYVTGTVNVGGFMEYFVLQNTRLSLVVRMAEVMADGIAAGLMLLEAGGTTDLSLEKPWARPVLA